MRRSSIFWLCPSVETSESRRASILDDIGYQVQFFDTIESLLREIALRRAQILILSDLWPLEQSIRHVRLLANIPDISGARLILDNTSDSQALMLTASSEGFRDMIPANLDDVAWLKRFEFSTSGTDNSFERETVPAVAEEALTIEVPTRIVWVNTQQLWMETRICPNPGEQVTLRGELANSLGLDALPVAIEQRQQTRLTYRFSEALIGEWYTAAVLAAKPESILNTMDALSRIDLGIRPRIFLAIQSPALRVTIAKYIDHRKYEVHTALYRQSLVNEPKYFSPDLVFIEDRLLKADGRKNFHEILGFLPDHATIVSIGAKEDSQQVKILGSGKRLRTLRHVPQHLGDLIAHEFLQGWSEKKMLHQGHRRAFFPPHDHNFSFGTVCCEATLVARDHLQLQFTSTVAIGNYSLIQLSPTETFSSEGAHRFLKIVHRELKNPGGLPLYLYTAQLCNLVERLPHSLKSAP